MDAKALAKSKRAHSQHHTKKSHPNHNHKPTSIQPGTAKKPPLRNHADHSNLPSQPSLPSNWDRYAHEIPGDEAPVPDAGLPKSKGADYRLLIAEARSQMQPSSSMDVFPSLDDALPRELSSGGSSMLAARGEGILSWIQDNSFIVDEKTIANPEASFLSLNLLTLAEQLTKLNVADRLFIEEDMLPSELLSERKAACDQQSSQMQTSDCQEGTRDTEKSCVTELYEKGNIKDGVRDATKASSSGYFGSFHQDPTKPSPTSSSQVLQAKASKYTEQPNTKPKIENANKKASTFEATTAEADLDMLLSSFSETIDLDTRAGASSSSCVDEVFKASPHLPSKGALLDDALDDLLQDTSYLTTSHKEKPLLPHSGTNSIEKDDFDSWLDSI